MVAMNVRQSGAALLMSLLILLVLSLLAVASMQNVSMQERMVSANRDAQIALEAAEQAAREAEAFLESSVVTLGNFGVQAGLYNKAEAPDMFADATWSSDASSVAATNPGGLAEQPRYFIEHIGSVTTGMAAEDLGAGAEGKLPPVPEGFRIVAWSSGRSGQAFRVIEVYYGK